MTRPNPQMLLLGLITLILSAWGLYGLMHDYGGMPGWLAVLTIAGLDLFALSAGRHAIDLARDGDSPAVWNAITVAVALVSAAAQYAHAALMGSPWIVGLVCACFPVATVLLFEGALRRAARLAGRESGRVAAPRATFELLQWLVYRKATWQAFRVAVADRTLGSDGAFKIGMVLAAPLPEPRADRRRDVELDYVALLGARGIPAAITGTPEDTPDGVRHVPDVTGGAPVSVSGLVRAAMSAGCDDLAAVTDHVRRTRPDAAAETIARAYRRAVAS